MDGSKGKVEEALEAERGWLRLRARRMIGPNLRRWVDSEDLVQQVQLDAARQMAGRTFETPAAFRGWLGKILRSRAVELARRRGCVAIESGVPEPRGNTAGPATRCSEQDEARAALRMLGSLSARDRRVVLLRVVEGKSFADVAAECGISEVNARVAFNRALGKLRSRGAVT